MPDPGDEMRRQLEFDKLPSQKTDRRPGSLVNEVLSSKRMDRVGKQAKSRPSAKAHRGDSRSGSDSNTSRRSRGH
jgi:hypothetical protein